MKRIPLPRISERIRGFTLPENGVLHVFDYDEVFKVDLRRGSVDVLAVDPVAFESEHPESLGVSEKPPLLKTDRAAITYTFDPSADSQTVRLVIGGQSYDIPFRTLSGDWFVATLTADEQYLVIAEPYGLDAYELDAEPTGSAE